MRSVDLSVVVPVYNSAESLPLLVSRLHSALAGKRIEVLLVDDGSADGSWPVIRELGRRDPAIRGLKLIRNYGQRHALPVGIGAARGLHIVAIDDDLAQPRQQTVRL